MKELLTKKYAGLPGWAWLLIGVAGVGAGYLLIRWQQKKSATPSALTTSNSADLTTGNASGNETNPATGTVGSNGVIDNPFPETTVNGQTVPIVPPGYQAVYDSNGNIVGWSPIASNPTPSQPTSSGTTPHYPALGTPIPVSTHAHAAALPASTPSAQTMDGSTEQPTAMLSPVYRTRRVS